MKAERISDQSLAPRRAEPYLAARTNEETAPCREDEKPMTISLLERFDLSREGVEAVLADTQA